MPSTTRTPEARSPNPETNDMQRIETLLAELEHEARTTRKHLERLPEDRFDWRPHPKSFTVGQLASHLVEFIRWTGPIFSADELDMGPSTYRPFSATSNAALLDAFDGGWPR